MIRFSLPPDLPPYALATYRDHRRAELLRMFSIGVLGLADAVLRRSLEAADWQVALFSVAPSASLLLAGLWGQTMAGRDKRPFFLLSGVISRLALLGLVAWDHPGWFIAVFAFASLADAGFIIAQTTLFQSNYPAAVRAELMSRVGATGRLALLAGALAAGALLDRFPGRGSWILSGGALVGFAGIWLYSRIAPAAPPAERPPERSFSLAGKLGSAIRILREEPAFRRYERNYFVYGLAFMLLLPVTVFLLVDHFRLSYKEISLFKLVVFQVGLMLTLPFAGRMMDRRGPYGTAGVAFLSLVVHPALLALAAWLRNPALLWAAFLCFGMSLAVVDVTWNLCSMHFARQRDSSPYMGVHIFLVGVRGLVGPWLGYGLYKLAGFTGALACACALFATAGTLMLLSGDRAEEDAVAARLAAETPR